MTRSTRPRKMLFAPSIETGAALSVSGLVQPQLLPVVGSSEREYELARTYRILLPVCRRLLVVRHGFRSDGASIPRLFWPIIGTPFDPNFALPCGLVHDALYRAELLPRPACDLEMRALLLANGPIAAARAQVIYRAVRLGGWWGWWHHRVETVIAARHFATLLPPDEDLVAAAGIFVGDGNGLKPGFSWPTTPA